MFQDSSSEDEDVGGSDPVAKATATADGDEPKGKLGSTEDIAKTKKSSVFDEDSDDDDDGGGGRDEGAEDKKKSDDAKNNEKDGDKPDAETTKEDQTSSLFDADSDDEDDDDEEFDDKKATEKTTNREKDGEDSSPAEKDKGQDSEEKEKKEDKKNETKKSFLDSDSDEGDEEFDDGGAVVGSAARQESKKQSKQGVDSAESPGESGKSTTKHSLRPPQKATVLEVDRPGDSVSFHMTKLPNLVGIQSSAFDENTYDEAEEEEQYQGYVHNMIRWRYKRDNHGDIVRDKDGKLVRESNTKLVKWSDGSYTMHIGNEAFDIQTVDSSSNGFAGLNGYIYLSQKSTVRNEGEDEETHGGTVLECMGPVSSRLVTKPSSLQSESHKSLTVAVRQKTVKKARIAEYVTQEDPEKLKQERIRVNKDESKIQSRRRPNYRSQASRRAPGMNSRYLEEDDDNYDSINIGALKKGNAMDDDTDDYGDDSDGDDDGYNETFRSRSRKRQKKVEEEEEEEEELVFNDESDEDDVTLIKAHKKKRPHQAVLEDDDDDD